MRNMCISMLLVLSLVWTATALAEEAKGRLPREAIKKVIDEHRAEIRWCYEAVLQDNPKLEGKVTLRWRIDSDGKVTRVEVTETTLESPAVEGCMVEKVKKWEFPKPEGGGLVEVNYPWVFKTK